MKRGFFITFEGADGCGKTTQINLLDEYCREYNIQTLLTREPGSRGLGVKLREILLNYDGEVSPTCESFLFLADRAQHIDCIIKPAIEEGKIVLCDRHIDSTVAYQGYGRGINLEQIYYLNNLATGGLKPDLTFVFDLDVTTALNRIGNSQDRMEASGVEFFNRVREGYLELAKQEPERIRVIDSSQSIECVHKKIVEIIKNEYSGFKNKNR